MLCEKPTDAGWLKRAELAQLERAIELEALEEEARAPLLPARQAVRATVTCLSTWRVIAWSKCPCSQQLGGRPPLLRPARLPEASLGTTLGTPGRLGCQREAAAAALWCLP